MIGIDLVETERIKKLLRNKKFLSRVFSEEEIKYCETKVNKEQHYSARYAAKEAVWKALSGKYNIPLKNIVVKNIKNGKPIIEILSDIKELKKVKIEVSLSHIKEYAIAVALVR